MEAKITNIQDARLRKMFEQFRDEQLEARLTTIAAHAQTPEWYEPGGFLDFTGFDFDAPDFQKENILAELERRGAAAR